MNFLDYLDSSLCELNAHKYEILYIYSDLRFFGKLKNNETNKNKFLKDVIDILSSKNKTVIIPTFSYTTSGIFEVQKSKTSLGALNAAMLTVTDVQRSEHPIFSFGAYGGKSDIVKKIGRSAFGSDCLHERLLNSNAAFVHIGRPVNLGNTIIHYIEKSIGVTYRIEKKFSTQVFDNGIFIGNDYSAFVRKKDNEVNDYAFAFDKAAKYLYQKGLVVEKKLNFPYSNISILAYDKTHLALKQLIASDQFAFLKNNQVNSER